MTLILLFKRKLSNNADRKALPNKSVWCTAQSHDVLFQTTGQTVKKKSQTNTRNDKHCWVKLKILIWALTTLGKKENLMKETDCNSSRKQHVLKKGIEHKTKVNNKSKSVRYLIIYSYLLNLLQFSSLIGQHHPVCICYHNSYHWQESN